MPIFVINGERIEARSEHQARQKYANNLSVEEVKIERDARLQSLKIPEWVKRLIEEDSRELAKIYKQYFVVSTTEDSEISISTFATEKTLDRWLREHFEDPDGSGWQVECAVKNNIAYFVKAKVSIEYTEIKNQSE